MKKIFSLIVALVVATGAANAFEYEPESGLSFMGLFGMNVSSLQNHSYGAKAGARMGLRADYMLPKAHGAYLTSGIEWSMKGGKLSQTIVDGAQAYDATAKYALHYIEIPLRGGFRYNITEGIGVYAEFGPYIAIGVGGRHKVSIDADGGDIRALEDVYSFSAFKKYDDLTETFQRWDAGLGFRVGAEYNNRYNLMLGCDWGLTDMYRTSLRDRYKEIVGTRLAKVHNFSFTLTVGYRF